MRFDRALYVAAYFSQSTVLQRSECTYLQICLLRWPEAGIRWKNNSRPVRGIIKTTEHETTRTAISIGSRSWWGLEQSVFWEFNQSMAGDRWKCASLNTSLPNLKAKNFLYQDCKKQIIQQQCRSIPVSRLCQCGTCSIDRLLNVYNLTKTFRGSI